MRSADPVSLSKTPQMIRGDEEEEEKWRKRADGAQMGNTQNLRT